MISLPERIARWEAELRRISGPGRWGECRRFAGRTAGIRIVRADWLRSHIAEARVAIDKATGQA